MQRLQSILFHFHKPLIRHNATASSSLTSSPASLFLHYSTVSPQQRCNITVEPPVTRFDESVQIRVSGLRGHSKVTLQAWVWNRWRRNDVVFVSHGHFYADQQGNLDLDTDPALDGTYTGVDPMGLFWSMRPLSGHAQDVRFMLRDATKPLVANVAVFSGHVTPDDNTIAMTSPKPLCVTSVQRQILASGVKRIEIREGRLRGSLFLPPGDGAHPGVIDMYGVMGGLVEARAALLAERGFAVLALAFMAFDDLPKSMEDVQFDYFEEAAAWLDSHPNVRAGGIGVVCLSSGACSALQMAIHCPQVKAVVVINGFPYQVHAGFQRHGQEFRRAVPEDRSKDTLTKEGIVTRDRFIVTDDDYFPVWQSDTRILFLVGQDDHVFPWEHALHFRDLYPPHKRHLIDVIAYPEAGHLVEPPFVPLCRYCVSPAVAGNNVSWGGEPRAHAVAQLDIWRRTTDFLHTWLGDDNTPTHAN